MFVERLWRSVEYEEVYLRAYDSVGDARASLGRYLDFYNSRRPHSSLDGMTPDQAYFPPRCPPLGSLTLAGTPLIERKICSDNRTTSTAYMTLHEQHSRALGGNLSRSGSSPTIQVLLP